MPSPAHVARQIENDRSGYPSPMDDQGDRSRMPSGLGHIETERAAPKFEIPPPTAAMAASTDSYQFADSSRFDAMSHGRPQKQPNLMVSYQVNTVRVNAGNNNNSHAGKDRYQNNRSSLQTNDYNYGGLAPVAGVSASDYVLPPMHQN